MGFYDALAEVMDSVRHEHEIAAYGRQVTGEIELPEQAAPSVSVEQVQDVQAMEPPTQDLGMER